MGIVSANAIIAMVCDADYRAVSKNVRSIAERITVADCREWYDEKRDRASLTAEALHKLISHL